MIDLASAAVQVRMQRGVFLASLRVLNKNPLGQRLVVRVFS